jgi:hypothetical protein
MEKRVRFRSRWLPYALVAPQIAITVIFFFWPALQALYQSFLIQDAFGTSTEFVGFDNFKDLFRNDAYLASFRVTAVFSVAVAFFGLTISLGLAALADRVIRGANAWASGRQRTPTTATGRPWPIRRRRRESGRSRTRNGITEPSSARCWPSSMRARTRGGRSGRP